MNTPTSQKFIDMITAKADKLSTLDNTALNKKAQLLPEIEVQTPNYPLQNSIDKVSQFQTDEQISQALDSGILNAYDIYNTKGYDYLSNLLQIKTAQTQEKAHFQGLTNAALLGDKDRTKTEIAKDSAISVATGTAGLVSGLSSFAEAGLRSTRKSNVLTFGSPLTNTLLIEGLSKLNKNLQDETLKLDSKMSPVSLANRENLENEKIRKNAVVQKEYEQAIANGENPNWAQVERMSKEFINTIQTTNPNQLTNSVLSSAPTLIGAGIGSRVAGLAGAYFVNTLLNSTESVEEAMKKVKEMSHEELLQNSEEYNKLIAEGKSPSVAKEHIIDSVASEALSTGLAVSSVTSAIDLPFITKLFPKKGASSITKLPEVVKTGGLSAVGNAAQEAGNKFSENLAISKYADKNVKLTDDVGKAAGDGFLVGLGMTAGVSGISVIPTAVKRTIDGVKTGTDTVKEKFNDVKSKQSEKKFTKAMDEVDTSTVPEEHKEAFTNDIPVTESNLSPEIKEELKPIKDDTVGSALVRLHKALKDEKISEKDKRILRVFAYDKLAQLTEFGDAINEKTKDLTEEELKKQPDLLKQVEEVIKIQQSPVYQDLAKEINNTIFTDEDFDKAEILEKTFKPEDLTPEIIQTVDRVLHQIDLNQGDKFKPAVIKSLIDNASVLGLSDEKVAQLKSINFTSEKAHGVTKDIILGGYEDGLNKMSLKSYQNNIGKAFSAKDKNKAEVLLTKLGKFNDYFKEKANRFSYAFKKAEKEKTTVNPLKRNGKPYTQRDGSLIAIHPTSKKFVQEVINDSKRIRETYDYLNNLKNEVFDKPQTVTTKEPDTKEVKTTKDTQSNVPPKKVAAIRDFRKPEYKFLGTFVSDKITVDGITYPTVEHAFQASKTNKPNIKQKIASLNTPEQARKYGNTIVPPKNWVKDRVKVMYDLLHAKFENPDLRQKLLDTEDAKIINNNGYGDDYWGVYKGKGKNILGRLLERVRSEIRASEQEEIDNQGNTVPYEVDYNVVDNVPENFLPQKDSKTEDSNISKVEDTTTQETPKKATEQPTEEITTSKETQQEVPLNEISQKVSESVNNETTPLVEETVNNSEVNNESKTQETQTDEVHSEKKSQDLHDDTVQKSTETTENVETTDNTETNKSNEIDNITKAKDSLVKTIKLDKNTVAAKEKNPHERALYTDNMVLKYGKFKKLTTPFATTDLRNQILPVLNNVTKIKNTLKKVYNDKGIEKKVSDLDAVTMSVWASLSTHMIETFKSEINIPTTERLYFKNNPSAYFLTEVDGRYEFPDTIVEAMGLGVLAYFDSPSVFGTFNEETSQIDGTNRNQVIADISRSINTALGLKLTDNVPAILGDNIERALAIETYQYMLNQGLIVETKNVQENSDKYYITVLPNENNVSIRNVSYEPTNIAKYLAGTDILDTVFYPEKSETKVSTKPFTKVDTTINKGVTQVASKLSKQELLDYSNRPMQINTELHNFLFDNLEEDGIKDIMGYNHFDPEKTNTMYLKVLKGKNITIETQLARWQNAYNKLIDDGFNFKEDSIYVPYKQGTVMRFFAQSKDMNYQLYKLHRELMNHKHDPLDLTNPLHSTGLELAIAQGLGVKVDKLSNDTALNKYQETINLPNYRKVIDNVKATLNKNATLDKESFVNLVKDIGEEAKTANALFTQAKYELAKESNATEFNTGITLELDGVTKGVSDLIMQMGLLSLDKAMVNDNLSRVGLFLNNVTTTYNTFIENNPDFLDTYNTAASKLQQILNNESKNFSGKNLKNKVFFDLLGDITLTEKGEYEVSRNATKKPLTAFQYGGSLQSFMNSITHTIENEIYKRINESINNPEKLQETQEIFDTLGYSIDLKNTNLVNFKISSNFKKYLREKYILPYAMELSQAIEFTIPKLSPIKSVLLSLTSIFGFLQQKQYDKAIEDLRTKHLKDGDRPRTDTLTRKDMREVITHIEKVALAFKSPFNTENSPINEYSWITNLKNSDKVIPNISKINPIIPNRVGDSSKLSFSNFQKEFTNPTVKILPFLTIAQEAKMMGSTITHFKDKTLKNVYDGAETHPGDVYDYHQVLNNSMNSVWTDYSLLSSVTERFKDLLAHNENLIKTLNEEDIPDTLKSTLYKLMGIPPKNIKLDSPDFSSGLTGSTAVENIYNVIKVLEDYTNAHNTFKKNLLAENIYSIDQMTGISEPVVFNKDDTKQLNNKTPLDIVGEALTKTLEVAPEKVFKDSLTQILSNEHAINFKERNDPKFTQDRTVTLNKERIAKYYSDIRKTSFNEVKHIPDILFNRIMKALPENTTVTLGSEKAIDALLATKYKDVSIVGSRGLTINNEIFITSTTGETLVHELIHSVIEAALNSYYGYNPNKITKETQTNIKQLENLMNDYINQFSNRPASEIDAPTYKLLNILKEYIDKGETVSALHEFIAWGLTHAELQPSLLTDTTSKIRRIKNKIMKFIKELLGLKADSNTYLEHLMNRSITLFKNAQKINKQPNNVIIKDGKTYHQLDLDEITSRDIEDIYHALPNDNNVELDTLFYRLKANMNRLLAKTNQVDGFYRENNKILFDENSNDISTTADEFINQGFKLTQQQELVFRLNQAILETSLQHNPQAVKRVLKYFDKASKELKYTDLMDNPNNPTAYTENVARNRYKALFEGRGITGNTELANFLSISSVYPPLQKALSNIKTLSSDKPETLGQNIKNIVTAMLNWVGNINTKDKNYHTLDKSIRILNDNLAFIKDAQTVSALDKIMSKTDQLETLTNGFATAQFNKLGDTILDKSNALNKINPKNRYAKLLVNSANLGIKAATGLMSEEAATVFKEAVEISNNELSQAQTLSDTGLLVNELVGGQNEGAVWRRLHTVMKHKKDTLVQQLRETTTANIRNQFKTMNKELSKNITNVLLKTDARSLLKQGMSLDYIASIIDSDTKLAQEITRNTKDIRDVIKHIPQNDYENLMNYYINQSKNTAYKMVNGVRLYGNVMNNAYSIANLANTQSFFKIAQKLSKDDITTLSELIDVQITLEALRYTNKADRKAVKVSMLNEAKEKNNAYNALFTLFDNILEQEKLSNPDLVGFGIKGYVPIRNNPHKDMVTVRTTEAIKKLKTQGYTVLDSYTHPITNETVTTMVSSEKTTTKYLSGIYNSINPMISGLNLETNNPQTAKKNYRIYGKDALGYSNNMVTKAELASLFTANPVQASQFTLDPILDKDFSVKGYYAPFDNAKIDSILSPDYDFANILGNYQARVYQSVIAEAGNNALFDLIKQHYEKDKKAGKINYYTFIDLNNPLRNNTHVNQVVNTFSKSTKDKFLNMFPDGRIPILKSEMNNIFGFKKASVTDIYDGTSNLPKPIQEAMKVVFTGMFGEKAPLYLSRGERALKELVSLTKGIIVVKSFTVARDNFLGNMLYLMVQGINPIKIGRWTTEAYLNLENYNKQVRELNDLSFYIENGINPENREKYKYKVKLLEKAIENNPVKPLIDEGLLPSITDEVRIFDDYSYTGKLKNAIKPVTDKLPQSVKAVGKEILVMDGSVVQKNLEKAVQYGDFVAKYALYKHLTTKNNPMTHRQAMDRATVEFVNYNLLSSRSRDYLDSVGVTWFLNYKLRMQRIIARAIREHPLRALFSIYLSDQLPLSTQNVLKGNIVTGNLNYAFGGVTNIPSGIQSHPLFWLIN